MKNSLSMEQSTWDLA